jgi:hypothetical protein
MVQGQSISLTENTIDEMLHLRNVGTTIPPNYKQDEIVDMCIRFASKYIVV